MGKTKLYTKRQMRKWRLYRQRLARMATDELTPKRRRR